MNCCICKNYAKFICECISPGVFVCNEHLDYHLSGPGNHKFKMLKNMDLFSLFIKDLKIFKIQIRVNSFSEVKKILEKYE